MIKYALFARLEAKPGKEQEVSDFLNVGLTLANQEATTPIWFALKLSPSTFGVFDAFSDRLQIKRISHHDDRPCHGFAFVAVAEFINERFIDLQNIYREPLQIT